MLLLELSSNPLPKAEETLLELESLREAAQAAPQEESFITWRLGKGDSSEEEDEGIWKPVDFGAGSSESDWDDDDGAVFAKYPRRRSLRARGGIFTEPEGKKEIGYTVFT